MLKILFIFSISIGWSIEFTFLTKSGYVTFFVKDEWKVISMNSVMPTAYAAFQIPNILDKNTEHSSNLVINVYELSSPKGLALSKEIGKQIGSERPKNSHYHGWEIYTQSSSILNNQYLIKDAILINEAVAVSIRLAWPSLPLNSEEYSSKMNSIFIEILKKVIIKKGDYIRGKNDVIRQNKKDGSLIISTPKDLHN